MKSDVWSLGCIAYEMCEMKSPFRNDNEKMSLMDLFNNITKGEYKPVSNKFSEDMRNIIQRMIIVDPQKRCDIQNVIESYNIWKEKEKSVFKIDSLIIMEDIAEKLNLLEYRQYFCNVRKRESVTRTFFALPDTSSNNKNDKFLYFYELSYWLIELLKVVSVIYYS
jgi:serine/threonine protein kinase